MKGGFFNILEVFKQIGLYKFTTQLGCVLMLLKKEVTYTLLTVRFLLWYFEFEICIFQSFPFLTIKRDIKAAKFKMKKPERRMFFILIGFFKTSLTIK